jgi:arabinofuranosyltransferase
MNSSGINSAGNVFQRYRVWLIPLVAAISLGGYILASRLYYRVGFPLDDAWIHQTYARNLALRGEWAFLPGQPSAGSTSPLWTALLAPGFWLGAQPFFWAFFAGWLTLSAIGLLGMHIHQRLAPAEGAALLAAGIFLCLEWHLVWAAASGMETLLFGVIVLLVFDRLLARKPSWLLLGVIVGMGIWIRPDGLTLVGPAIFCAFFLQPTWKSRLRAVLEITAGTLVCALPYLLFNRSLSGEWWPNTFFAKQAEYAVLGRAPLVNRYMQQFGLVLVGAGALLLPGFLLTLIRSVRERCWPILAMAIWFLGFLLVYAVRLPVIYQHGRYIIPSMPVYLVLGLVGMTRWVRLRHPDLWRRVISRAWAISLSILLASFWLIGAQAYGRDVAVIESEMVAAAKWIAQNTPPQALIAAHDIGALGYFGERKLVDLAGLVSPEVIPFIRDEDRLMRYLNEAGVSYLMTFPGWYPELVNSKTPVFQTHGIYSPLLGGENMQVYSWP